MTDGSNPPSPGDQAGKSEGGPDSTEMTTVFSVGQPGSQLPLPPGAESGAPLLLPPPPAADPNRLHISAEELAAPSISERVEQMRQAAVPQLVRPVGAATSTGRSFGAAGTMLLAGLVGGLVGWVGGELLSQSYAEENAIRECFASAGFPDACSYEPWYGTNLKVGSIMFVAPIAILLGAVIAGWDGISARSQQKFWSLVGRALPVLIAAGVIGGWLGQAIYESATKDATSFDDRHFPRGLAWAVFGCGIGLALGVASKSSKRAINGAIGGAIGGFIGGFAFDYINLSDSNGIPNRLIGITITGAVVGLAIGIVETARREHWLEIVSGGMAGKQFILYNDRTTIGSGHTADITLIKDPGISGEHAVVERSGASLNIRPVAAGAAIQVNGVVSGGQSLTEGDLVQLGSTVVRYRAKQAVMPTGMPHLAGGGPIAGQYAPAPQTYQAPPNGGPLPPPPAG